MDQHVGSLITFIQTALAINSAVMISGLIIGVRLVRALSRLELQIDLMWEHFQHTVIKGSNDE